MEVKYEPLATENILLFVQAYTRISATLLLRTALTPFDKKHPCWFFLVMGLVDF